MSVQLNDCLVKPGTKITLPWNSTWPDICAWAVEQFGLPGTKYIWHPKHDTMEFYFLEEADAIHMMLRWS